MIYKKWNYIILLNNLILSGFTTFQKKLLFLQFDFYKYSFYNYSKTTSTNNDRIISIKNKIKQKY